MSYYDAWNQYMEQMQRIIEKQSEQLNRLEKRLDQVEKDLESQQQKPTTNVEKIEYKFDQLKIETLEGTLNIGFTPGNSGMGVEDFSIPQEPFPPKLTTGDSVKEKIMQELNQYVAKEGPPQLQSLMREYGQQYDETYQQFILQDVHKQLGDRITHYMNQSSAPNGVVDENHKNDIVTKIKQEISQSLRHFVENQSRKGDGAS
ncbi:spore germination protein GerPC [Pontibacillus salicampi]|uniref:Spore germination protein GerPC n=1 Tax=Pontibacillus salicampi TaxID=1449801 RepID=A0ABV6LRE8_9BACI